MDISVLTLSTSACRGDYRARLDLMIRELAALAPDVILLQDVFATADGRYNTAAAVARWLGMTMAFHPARPAERHLDGRPIDCHAGLAVLARMPIYSSVRIELPREPAGAEHIGQMAEIACGEERLLVLNVQLSDRIDSQALNHRQREHVHAVVEESELFDHILVGGDFGAAEADAARDRIAMMDRSGDLRLQEARAALDRRDAITGLTVAERPAMMATIRLPGRTKAPVLVQAAE